ncbi:MAG: SUMF1/EgtB/PvdO family nonheme iron enzyme [Deltaproteobacteria bacterium]|jgi:hypothetical protein|nr:SUMF1/EgtB/PvdO family nonheme iron enzyme [Deltaproteobacteria bacterium]MBW2532844.1 SUMF1/EgtB/PvdO family nonheme iron enzyme [Deltaproteobacteria bacterium]
MRSTERALGGSLWLALLVIGCSAPAESDAQATAARGTTSAVPRASETPTPGPASAETAAAQAPPAPIANRSDLLCAEGVSEAIDHDPLPCPPEMAHIGRYCIDRWEGHLVVRDSAGRAVRHPHYERLEAGVRYEARSAPEVFPQAYISRVEAQAACTEAGKRLCRWLEWRRACQGKRWNRFPYGNSLEPGACNHLKEHLLPRFFGHDPRLWKQEHFDDPRLNQEPGFLARTGSHPGCISPDGTRDQVGNLHEWVEDPVTVSFMERLAEEGVYREKQPWRPGNGMFLGGFYSTRAEHGPGCHFTTAAHGPTYHDYSTGFRCCKDAQKPPAPAASSPARPK